MLESRRLELQAQMDAAVASGDTARIDALRRTIDRETLECTAHTAERLKRVEKDVGEIKTTVIKISNNITAYENRVEGAKWLWKVLGVVASAGGGAVILKLLTAFGGAQ